MGNPGLIIVSLDGFHYCVYTYNLESLMSHSFSDENLPFNITSAAFAGLAYRRRARRSRGYSQSLHSRDRGENAWSSRMLA